MIVNRNAARKEGYRNGARRCLECVRILDRQYKARKAQKEA